MSYLTVPVSHFKNFTDPYDSTENHTLLNAIAESTELTKGAIYEAIGFTPTDTYNEDYFYFHLDHVCNCLKITLKFNMVIMSNDNGREYLKIDINPFETHGQSNNENNKVIHIAKYGCNYEAFK